LRLAFIYDSDSTTAQAFRSMLDCEGFQTFLLPLNDLDNADFAGCDAILLGSDTGSWSDATDRSAVLNAGLPIGAIGDGGLSFLSQAGIISGLTSGSDSAATVVATPRGHDAYSFPNAVPLSADQSVQIFSSASNTNYLDLATPLPNGVEIGRLDNTTHYPIVQLQDKYLLWGFTAGPAAMTHAGQDLFANAIAFHGESLVMPLRSRRFAPPRGAEQAFLSDLSASSNGLHALIQLNQPPGDPSCNDLTNLVPRV
jgi:hypothetical protein